MQCVNHGESEAQDICAACGQPLCGDCLINLGEKSYCRPCLEKVAQAHGGGSGAANITIPAPKNKFIAFILSLIPGVGYFYLGFMKRGLQALLLFFGSIFISSAIHLDELTALFIPVLMFYTIFDTQQLLSQINQGAPVEDRELFKWNFAGNTGSLVAYGLIGAGVLALIKNLMPLYMYQIDRVLFPGLLLALGIYLLVINRKGGKF